MVHRCAMTLTSFFALCLVSGVLSFVAVPRNHVKTGWTRITSHAQLAFAHSGDTLYLYIDNATLHNDLYTFDLFGLSTKLGNGPDHLQTMLKMPFLTYSFYKNDTDNDWYIGAGDCTHKFKVNPTLASDDSYTWAFYFAAGYVRVICNDVWVLDVKKEQMLLACFDSGLVSQYMGAVQLNDLKGYKYRVDSFDELKERDYCLLPNNLQLGQSIGSKRAFSIDDCANDCKFYPECERAAWESCLGVCNFYRNDGTDSVSSSLYAQSLEERYALATEVPCLDLIIDLSCTNYTDSPCMRFDTRFTEVSQYRSYKESSQLNDNPRKELINVKQCFDETFKTQRFVEWNPTYLSCGSIDPVYQNGPFYDTANYMIFDRQCESDLANKTGYEPCFEVGVILEGQIIEEIYNYNYQLDCQESCRALETCTGWSAITNIRTCYLYTGRVFKEPFSRAVSGTYNCNKEFAQVPPPGHFIVQPTGTEFNLIADEGPKIFNLFLLVNNRRRTIKSYKGDDNDYIFTVDFFLHRQHSEYDLRLKDCDAMYNYTVEPCVREPRTTNLYTIEMYYDVNDEINLKMTCGETYKDTFFHQVNLTTDCSMNFDAWDAFKFISFEENDSYNFGDSADVPPRTGAVPLNPTTTWLPDEATVRGSGGHAGHKKKKIL